MWVKCNCCVEKKLKILRLHECNFFFFVAENNAQKQQFLVNTYDYHIWLLYDVGIVKCNLLCREN